MVASTDEYNIADHEPAEDPSMVHDDDITEDEEERSQEEEEEGGVDEGRFDETLEGNGLNRPEEEEEAAHDVVLPSSMSEISAIPADGIQKQEQTDEDPMTSYVKVDKDVETESDVTFLDGKMNRSGDDEGSGDDPEGEQQTPKKNINTSFQSVKRYNFMVAGPSASGKSTFCKWLLSPYMPCLDTTKYDAAPCAPTTTIRETARTEKKQGNTTILFTIVDTPGYGDTMNNRDRLDPVEQYIDEQNSLYESTEQFRRPHHQKDDTRIHCCFYFLAPHRVTDLDREFLTRLQSKVAITPIIAKADTMTVTELETHLSKIRTMLKESQIQIFDYKEDEADMHRCALTEEDKEAEDEEDVEESAFQRVGSLLASSTNDVLPTYDGRRVSQPRNENNMVLANGSSSTCTSTWTCTSTHASNNSRTQQQLPRSPNMFAIISCPRPYMWGTATHVNPRHSDTQRLHRLLFEAGSLGRLQLHANALHEAWRMNEGNRRESEQLRRKEAKLAERRRRTWCGFKVCFFLAVMGAGLYAAMAVYWAHMAELHATMDTLEQQVLQAQHQRHTLQDVVQHQDFERNGLEDDVKRCKEQLRTVQVQAKLVEREKSHLEQEWKELKEHTDGMWCW